ncbi:MAG: hypothetical protein JSW38_00830 [Dehalococcoidia bacterium]|nr:MAG: hypothetical protein JSW38_00830 [Dehalococcoidia bacterium]
MRAVVTLELEFDDDALNHLRGWLRGLHENEDAEYLAGEGYMAELLWRSAPHISISDPDIDDYLAGIVVLDVKMVI